MTNAVFNVDVKGLTISWINNDCFDKEGPL